MGLRLYVPLITGSAVVAVALAFASPAPAAPPALQSVGHVKRHPKATWVLPPDSEAAVAEVATSPRPARTATSSTRTSRRSTCSKRARRPGSIPSALKPGTYYVHVASYTPSCFECPSREWSQVLPLVIRNQKPRISRLRIRYTGRYVIRDMPASATATTRAAIRPGSSLSITRWRTSFENRRGTPTTSRFVPVARRERSPGTRPTVSSASDGTSDRLQVQDDDGAVSNKLSRKWYVTD